MLQLLPDRAAVSSERSVVVDVLVRITPVLPDDKRERTPLNLALVLDRSGSMAGEKMRLTCRAASQAVESLLEGDTMSIVLFDPQVDVLVSRACASEKSRALALLSRVSSGGQTALFDGWRQGTQEVLTLLDKQRMNRVVLLTDGEANVGECGVDPICTAVHQYAGQGVQTTTLGVGTGYNEELLRAMAASGDGNHFFVETNDQLGPFIEMELNGLRATQGKQVRMEMVAAAGVRLEWLGEVKVDADGRVKLADLVAHCPLQRVLRLHVPAAHRGPLLRARLQWECAAGGGGQELVQVLELPVRSEGERLLVGLNREVVSQVAVAELARLRAQAMELLRQDEEKAALGLLRQALSLAELPADDRVDLEDLIRTVEQGHHSSGHKKAAMSGHAYSSGHGSGHYKQSPKSSMGTFPLREGRLLSTVPSQGARAWNRVEGMLRGLFYGERLGLGPRPPLGEASSLVCATLQFLRSGPFEINGLVQALDQAPVLSPSPGLAGMRARLGMGRPWNHLGGDTAGCGALRRLAPLLVPHCASPQSTLWRQIGQATAITHKNNAALVASYGTMKVLWELLAMPARPAPEWYLQHFLETSLDLEDGRSYPCHGPRFPGWRGTLCQFLSSSIPDARAKGLVVPQVMAGWGSGPYVLEMVPNWLYIMERHAHEPEVAMSRAVTNTIESHSLGALVGAALGALHGPRPGWLLPPELERELQLTRDRWF